MARRALLKAGVALAIAVLVTAAGAFAWMRLAPRHTPHGQAPLRVLDSASLDSFRESFNGAGGQVRVLVMLSPT
jgi:hypothetical protein